MDFPELKTNRLLLKEIGPSASNDIFEIFSNPEVVKYYDLKALTEHAQADNLIQFFRKRFENNSGIRWGVYLANNYQCIGTCGFNSWDKNMHSTTIGYDLNQKYWGQGITTEALYSIIKYIFSESSLFNKVNRIQADTIPGNIASEKVLLKLGFKEEGLRRQSGFWKNKFHDLKCFGLLKEEFR